MSRPLPPAETETECKRIAREFAEANDGGGTNLHVEIGAWKASYLELWRAYQIERNRTSRDDDDD